MNLRIVDALYPEVTQEELDSFVTRAQKDHYWRGFRNDEIQIKFFYNVWFDLINRLLASQYVTAHQEEFEKIQEILLDVIVDLPKEASYLHPFLLLHENKQAHPARRRNSQVVYPSLIQYFEELGKIRIDKNKYNGDLLLQL